MKRIILIISLILLGMTTSGNNIKETQDLYGESSLSMSSDTTIIQIPDWETGVEVLNSGYGESISSGDLNGDGYDDVAVGAPSYNSAGAVFIYYGSSSGPSTVPDKVISGRGTGFGIHICCEGDVNNDGYNDLNIYDGGHVFSYHGSAAGLMDTSHWISNTYGSVNFSSDISSGGDLNGDGYDDLMLSVSNYHYDTIPIGALVFLGSEDGLSDSSGYSWAASILGHYDVRFEKNVSITGDVNGDGFDDAVVTLATRNDVLIYFGSPGTEVLNPPDMVLNNNTYKFGKAVSILKDINNDGYDEIAIGDLGFLVSSVFIYYGSPIGILQNYNWTQDGPRYCFANNVYSAGDFNRDGYNDLSVSNCELPGVRIYFGSSAGLYNIPTGLNKTCNSISSGDVNGDGISDVIFANESKAYGFFGSSDRVDSINFTSRDTILSLTDELCTGTYVKSQYGLPMSGVSVNFNVKGANPDSSVSVSDSIGYAPFCYTGENPGKDTIVVSFADISDTAYVTWQIAGISEYIDSVSPGMNSVSVNRSSNIEITFIQNMDASSLNSTNIIVEGSYTGAITSNINYNSSSKTLTLDPLIDFKTGEKISVTLKSGIKTENNIPIDPFIFSFISEVSGTTDNYLLSDILYNSENFETGDIDRDGDIDILTSYRTTGIKVLKNNGAGHFSDFSTVPGGTNSFILKDLDVDGDLDIICGGPDNTINYYSNDGTGVFSFSSSSPGNLYKGTGDFDGDGDLDMAVILSGFDMTIYRNDSGVFNLTATIPVPNECNNPQWYNYADYEIDDMDGDGDLDIIESYHSSWESIDIFQGCMYLLFFRNDGAGNFTKEIITSGQIGGNSFLTEQCFLTLFNINGDNTEDILLYDKKLINSGNAEFNISSSTWFIGKPKTADIDGDGDLDFLNGYVGEIFKNDGSGNFTHTGNLTPNSKLSYADINNDGDLDILLISNNRLTIYSNSDSLITQPVQLNADLNFPAPSFFYDQLFGYSANSAGDVNGDGYDDVIIGSPVTPLPLKALLYYGGQNMDNLSDITFDNPGNPNFGYSATGTGDLNGDGFDDIIIGAYGNEINTGKAYVYLGGLNPGTVSVELTGEQPADSFGFSLSEAGDINGDGYADLIVGAKGFNNGTGRAYIYFGGPTVDNVADVILTGETIGDNFGKSVSTARDVNGDGYSDVIVGAYKYLNNTGRAYIYFGGQNMNNTADVILTGAAAGFDLMFGSYVATAGDVNNDGFGDIAIGEGDELHCTNKALIFLGGANMDNIPDIQLYPGIGCENFAPVFNNEDYDGDSYSDVIVGAWGFEGARGKAYLYRGGSEMDNSADFYMTGTESESKFGFWVSTAGDVNADGYSDLIVGAPKFGPENNDWGMAYIYLGSGDPARTLAGLEINADVTVQQDGNMACVTGYVNNKLNQPIDNIRINYFIKGANNGYGSGFSDGNGIVRYCYSGVNSGIDTVVAVSGRFRDTAFVFWGSQENCIIGNEYVVRNSVNLYYTESLTDVYWDISNFNSTQASIISNNHNDSVYVNAGGNYGHFVLYLVTPDSTMCVKHVYVDEPSPVELAAFISLVSGRDVTLNWSTSNELNNSGFEIERAVDNGQKIIDNGQKIIDNGQKIIDNGQLIIDSWDKAGFVEGNGTTNEPKQYTFTDKNLNSGNYKYRLRQIDFNGNFEYFELSESVSIGIPDKFNLSQNYPNPFNPVTNLGFGISELGYVTLKIYDVSGKEVVTLVNEVKEPGYYTIKFYAANLSSGVYFYRMTAGDFVAVKKLVVLK